MMRHITQKQDLRSAKELATDTVYTRSMSTGWKPPAEARECVTGCPHPAGCRQRRQSTLMTHTTRATAQHGTWSGSSAGSPCVPTPCARHLLACWHGQSTSQPYEAASDPLLPCPVC